MGDLRSDRAARWFATPTIVALICIVAGAWIQLKTAGLMAFAGAPLYVVAAALTLFAAYLVGYRARRKTVSSYAASVALLAAVLLQWDTVEPNNSWMRIVALLGHDAYRPPTILTRGHPVLRNVLVAIPWLVAMITVFARLKRDTEDCDESGGTNDSSSAAAPDSNKRNDSGGQAS